MTACPTLIPADEVDEATTNRSTTPLLLKLTSGERAFWTNTQKSLSYVEKSTNATETLTQSFNSSSI
ncbi:8508_t:CDS:2 [Acaulospora morrowiae]|uniref:8508_t:CDS:1 n=1 Tax=Acaulospora morrowiae TaxID=94023 RepID=A0A9N9A2W5_9GLOM|nr:8508_t:CDS:2 [Acaulospora morrowiae]